ncbi:hypothetical protein V5E97_12525 [Singulisphaera sp. Ch08]|uniref:Uncharacterized protein n=1 Tax=Singulisphaera sp. Ch08 TaxID=3120278 RepID=A0AAU7CPH9_9BACT
MSKMGCECGNILSDFVYPCPTEAMVIGEQDLEFVEMSFQSQVENFLVAVRDHCREAWLVEQFGTNYPMDCSDAEVISDLLTRAQNPYVLSITECESCGRLHVQTSPESNKYLSFAPDIPGYHRLLACKPKGG